jgi:undecaprenyl diphosphate synthase
LISPATQLGDVPKHVAIMMDGNGRWAAERGLPRSEGHRRGVEALRRAVRAASKIGVKIFTVFSFSVENWTRPVAEVGDLMRLLRQFIREDLSALAGNNVQVPMIGERSGLDPEIRALIEDTEVRTQANTGLLLLVAFNYSSRLELAHAARRIVYKAVAGEIEPSEVTAEMLDQHTFTAGLPDPELIIRTSGEQRLSNFLLWQAAYAELIFMPIYVQRQHLDASKNLAKFEHF